ncbi:MAG: hypothetical protein KKF44_10310 [Nanoarchaeota archaeon]|nr:hypothetical protein [Nanoarchaeota archaeon]
MALEIRRKIWHLMQGIIIVYLLNLDIPWLSERFAYLLLLIGIIGLIISMISKKSNIPIIHKFLEHFGREKELMEFPGKGAFYYFMGAFFAVLYFSRPIASAAILILAYGDSINHLIGKYYGRIKTRLHPEKLLEGTIAGIVAAAIAAAFYVPLLHAFIASGIVLTIEMIEMKFLKIDDNFFIPLLSGLILTLLG